MSTPTETPVRAQGFGARRFLVRGSIYAPEPGPSLLRPRYNEYPERYTLNPEFPFPGKRGGSRPRVDDAARVVSPRDPNFPAARPRVDEVSLGRLPVGTSPEASAVNKCAGEGGTFFTRSASVLTTVTTVLVSDAIQRPFLLRHAQGFAGADLTAGSGIIIKIAVDQNTAGGQATSGTNIEGLGITSATFAAVGVALDIYPEVRWTITPAFLKFIFFNLSAGTLFFYTAADIVFLD